MYRVQRPSSLLNTSTLEGLYTLAPQRQKLLVSGPSQTLSYVSLHLVHPTVQEGCLSSSHHATFQVVEEEKEGDNPALSL